MSILSSEILMSELGPAKRLEAEYYQPHYLRNSRQLDAASAVPISRFIEYLTDGTHVTPRYVEAGIPFLSSSNIDPLDIQFFDSRFISNEEHASLSHCQPQGGDVLVSKSGRIGCAAVVNSAVKQGSFNIYEGIALLRMAGIDPWYVAAFLNSSLGYTQIRRELKGVAQPHLHLEDIRRLRIIVPSDAIRADISRLAKKRQALVERARQVYVDARTTLYTAIGMSKGEVSRRLVYETTLSEMSRSHRFDAQHFRPEYSAALVAAQKHLGRDAVQPLWKLVTFNQRGKQPVYVDNGPVAVVNSQHLGPQHVHFDELDSTSREIYDADTRSRLAKNDVLVYSTGAYVGSTNIWLESFNAVAGMDNIILRFRPQYDPAYMALVLNSEIGALQTQKHITGSAQAHLYSTDIAKFMIPILPPKAQENLGDLVRESYSALKESKALLEKAKRRVEELVEKETTA